MNLLTQADRSRTTDLWAPYVPTEQTPWNLRRAVHLHRRTGFAATWDQLQRTLSDGPKPSIDRILNGPPDSETGGDGFEQLAKTIGDAAVHSNQPVLLQAWWIYRMLKTPRPLTEKIALLWHNHFATSNRKLEDLAEMKQQNELFRRLGLAPFAELLTAVVNDPALLIWLDAPENHKQHPNENLARELMELFTLGIGHYSETDVKEAARALTGWTILGGEIVYRNEQHDDAEKTILGRRQPWDGDQLLALLLEQPATAHRLSWRLCEQFLGERVATADHIAFLADGLQTHDLNIAWGVETILRSQLFFSDPNIRQRVAEPPDFIIGSARALELTDPPPQTNVLADWMTRLGQDLFYPPNVGGWHGGREWLRTGALISRANFAAGLAAGHFSHTPPDWKRFADKHNRGRNVGDFVAFLADLLFGGEPDPGWTAGIVKSVAVETDASDASFQSAVAAVLASPEAQIC